MLGLPDDITALLFDLDGVLTPTAKIHFKAWKQTFDEFLKASRRRLVQGVHPGRLQRVRRRHAALRRRALVPEVARHRAARGRRRRWPPGKPTVHGLGNRKNDLVLETDPEGRRRALRRARCATSRRPSEAGLRARRRVLRAPTARTCCASAGIEDLFDAIIDGKVADEQHLQGKPAPGHLPGRRQALGVEPVGGAPCSRTRPPACRPATTGTSATSSGVDRVDHADALRAHGADVVVKDLAELLDA